MRLGSLPQSFGWTCFVARALTTLTSTQPATNPKRNPCPAKRPHLSSCSSARVPGSVLLLLKSSHSKDPSNGVETNLKAEAAARGVHPERVRLDEMLSREEHIWVRGVPRGSCRRGMMRSDSTEGAGEGGLAVCPDDTTSYRRLWGRRWQGSARSI